MMFEPPEKDSAGSNHSMILQYRLDFRLCHGFPQNPEEKSVYGNGN